MHYGVITESLTTANTTVSLWKALLGNLRQTLQSHYGKHYSVTREAVQWDYWKHSRTITESFPVSLRQALQGGYGKQNNVTTGNTTGRLRKHCSLPTASSTVGPRHALQYDFYAITFAPSQLYSNGVTANQSRIVSRVGAHRLSRS